MIGSPFTPPEAQGLYGVSNTDPHKVFGGFWKTRVTSPKTNMDTQNDGLEMVTPFKHGHFC